MNSVLLNNLILKYKMCLLSGWIRIFDLLLIVSYHIIDLSNSTFLAQEWVELEYIFFKYTFFTLNLHRPHTCQGKSIICQISVFSGSKQTFRVSKLG